MISCVSHYIIKYKFELLARNLILELANFVLKNDLTHSYKDDFLSQTARFLDSNSSINHGDSRGSKKTYQTVKCLKYFKNRQF